VSDQQPEAHVQWKGTEACLDVFCVCGCWGHVDGFFADHIKCEGCGTVWRLPNTLVMEREPQWNGPALSMEPEI
jgi:hypothetical protein